MEDNDSISVEEAAPESAETGENPPATEPEPSPPKRNPILFGLGLTLMICGALMLAYHGFGLVMISMTERMGSALTNTALAAQAAAMAAHLDAMPGADLQEQISQLSAAIHSVQLIADIVSAALALLAVGAAVGLLIQAKVGRWLAIGWGAAAVVYLIAETIVYITYVTPLMDAQSDLMVEWTMVISENLTGNANLGVMQSQMMDTMSGVQSVARHAMSVVYLILPVLALILLNLKRARQAVR